MFFIAYFILLMQQTPGVKLVPVDAGIEDRGSHSGSLRAEPKDLRQDNAFEKLYKVAGSDGVYVRKAGGLRAVFRNSAYFDTKDGSVPLIPAGTVYSIGEMRVDLLGQLEELFEPTTPDELIVAQRYNANNFPPIPITTRHTSRGNFKFLDDEVYRRERMALFVLNIVLAKNPSD